MLRVQLKISLTARSSRDGSHNGVQGCGRRVCVDGQHRGPVCRRYAYEGAPCTGCAALRLDGLLYRGGRRLSALFTKKLCSAKLTNETWRTALMRQMHQKGQ